MDKPSYNEAAKMFDIVNAYLVKYIPLAGNGMKL